MKACETILEIRKKGDTPSSVVVYNCTAEPFSIFLNIAITNETFQKSGKQDSFIHILKRSANMYESSCSVFRTNTRIQSRPDISNE